MTTYSLLNENRWLQSVPLTHCEQGIPHFYKDATEKVLILRKVAQDKVYLYVLCYFILYVKTVFQ